MKVLPVVCAAMLFTATPLLSQDFFDNFNRPDGPPESWFIYQGVVEIVDNELLLESAGEVWTWIDQRTFGGDLTIQFEVRFDRPDGSRDIGRHGGIVLFGSEPKIRWQGLNGYIIDWIDRRRDRGYRFHKWIDGVEEPIVPDGMFRDRQDPARVWKITVSGPTIRFEADGELLVEFDDSDYRMGHIGLWGYSNGQHIHIDNLVVGEAPTANIAADPTSGPVPLTVRFDGSASASPRAAIAEYGWDFGDGQTATGPQVTHDYLDPGVYTARLTVTDSAGASSSAVAEITARCEGGDVTPWSSVDVGMPLVPGCASLDLHCLEVLAGGRGIGGRRPADEFHFVHLEVEGDASLVVRIDNVDSQRSAMAGIMLRESLDPDSAFVFLGGQTARGRMRAAFMRRPTTGGRAVNGRIREPLATPDAWFRIERQGEDFISSISMDGQGWMPVQRATVAGFPAKVLAGLAVTAGDARGAGATALVNFCDMDGFPDALPPPLPEFKRGDADSDGNLTITDAIRILLFLFRAGEVPSCMEAADADDDGALRLTDAVRILNYLHAGSGLPPSAPGPSTCGPDPRGSPDLGCSAYTGC